MAVEHRVAFALMFLSDRKLCELKKLTQKLSEDGNLDGFLLTGASLEGIQLLNRYLAITGDVQSCSLIAIRVLPPKLLQENQVEVWIKSKLVSKRIQLLGIRAKSNDFMSSCPSFRKPLPRCAICLMLMGTVSGLQMTHGIQKLVYAVPNVQTRRSYDHIMHWFRESRVSGNFMHLPLFFPGRIVCNRSQRNVVYPSSR